MRIDDHTLTRADVAWLLGMSDSWVRDRMQAGELPRPGATADEYVQAYVEFRTRKLIGDDGELLNKEQEQARLAREQADSKAMDNAERRGDLASRADLSGAVIGLIKVTIGRLMQVPAAVSQGDGALRAKIEAAMVDALRDLSMTKVEAAMGGGFDEEEAPDDEPGGA